MKNIQKVNMKQSPSPKVLLIPLNISAEEALKRTKEFFGIKPKESPNIKIKVPNGLSKCEVCGEYNGTAKWKELSEYPHTVNDNDYFSVSCLCQGILCNTCKQNKIHRPISNSYYEDENCIWHNPGAIGMRWCDECSNKNKLIKLDKECPLVLHTEVGRLFSIVRRMKAEKEINLPINYRSGFSISIKTEKTASEMTEQEWEIFYQDLRNQLKKDYPDRYYSLFPEENNS